MNSFSKSVEVLEISSGVGGGRGVFAKEDVGPGFLLLREQALISMPHDREAGEVCMQAHAFMHAKTTPTHTHTHTHRHSHTH